MIIFGTQAFREPEECLTQVSGAGFASIEAGLPLLRLLDCSHELPRLLANHNLRLAAIHLEISDLDSSQEIESILKLCRLTSCVDVISSGAINGGYTTRSLEHTAETLRVAGGQLKSQGVQLHYHHYDWDIIRTPLHSPKPQAQGPQNNKPAIDTIMQNNTDIGLVYDHYWACAAERNLKWALRKFPDQISIIHLKDGDPIGGKFSCLCHGKLGIQEICTEIKNESPSLVVYEQDHPDGDNVTEDLQRSGFWLKFGRIQEGSNK